MVSVAEHVYHDDPMTGPEDVRTRLSGVSYFFLGNGAIQAAVQFAPDGEGTPLGLLIMDPERLGKKRDALTMDADDGLKATVVRVQVAGRFIEPSVPGLTVAWLPDATHPTVEACWGDDAIRVTERFVCVSGGGARLLRTVTLRQSGTSSLEAVLTTGAASDRVLHPVMVPPATDVSTRFEYRLDAARHRVDTCVVAAEPDAIPAAPPWHGVTDVQFNEPLLDHLFRTACWQLPAAVSARGRQDGSIWQYNREWVRDQANIAVALTQLGQRELAATMFRRLLTEFVTDDGATLDSSEVRGRDDVELDQTGVLLQSLEQYVWWTGDIALVADHWAKVRAVAEYPLRPEFRHTPSGMLSGSREYWERHAAHGIEPGLELVYQVFVSAGLSRAAALAHLLGHRDDQQRWQAASHSLREACLSHPVFALHDSRGFIKRRTLDGRVQETIVAGPDSGLPAGVPLVSGGAHPLNPDTCSVWPIILGMAEPDSSVARATLRSVEALWNQRWATGGYGRYHVQSEPDSPGAWPFASLFVARAAVEAGDSATAWRVLRWLRSVPGGLAGSWFEFYGERIAPPFPQVGIVPWTWAELILLFIHHVLGIRPGAGGIHIRPRLLAGMRSVHARLPIGDGWLDLTLNADDTAPLASTVVSHTSGTTRMTIPVRTLP